MHDVLDADGPHLGAEGVASLVGGNAKSGCSGSGAIMRRPAAVMRGSVPGPAGA